MEPKPIECYKVQILLHCTHVCTLVKWIAKAFFPTGSINILRKINLTLVKKKNSMVWTFDQGLYFKMNNHHRHLENSVLTCSWTICGCVPWQLLDKNQKSAQKDCCYTVPLDSSVPYTCKEVIQTGMTMNTKMIDHIIIL